MKELSKCPVILILISWCLAVALVIVPFSASAQEVQRIKPEELKKLIESGADIVVVDNQPKGAYDLGHIKGAINFPWAKDIKNPVNLPRNKTLILYCDCVCEEDSTDLADQQVGQFDSCSSQDDSTDVAEQLMSKFGYKNIKTLEGGWSKWQQSGYPVDKK